MNLDIKNIASTSKKNWKSIYEVIHDDYFKAVTFISTEFLKQCKKSKWASEHNKWSQSSFKNMAMENRLYTQVVVIHRSELYGKK